MILAIGLLCFGLLRKKGGGGGCCGSGHSHQGHGHGGTGTNKPVDPVCNMEVEPTETTLQSEHNGQTVYFCSPHCKQTFDSKPDSFIDTAKPVHQDK